MPPGSEHFVLDDRVLLLLFLKGISL